MVLGVNSKNYFNSFVPGYMSEVSSFNGECTRLPTWVKDISGSVKTSECITMHHGNDCNSDGVFGSVIRPEGGQFVASGHFKSFSDCTNLEKGTEVNVDLEELDESFQSTAAYPFRDVCTCRNFPNAVKQSHANLLGLRLYGNCVYLYDQKNCKGSRKSFGEDGISYTYLGKPGSFQSFQPCDIPPQCFQ